MSKIEWEDISNIISGLSAGDAVLQQKLIEAKEKNWIVLEGHYTEFRERIRKAFQAVVKLREELNLPSDPVMQLKRGKK